MWANLLLKTYRELWQKKGLVISLSLVLAIATGAYIGMTSVYQDLKFSRDQFYHHNRLANFTVLCTAVPQDALATINKLPNVRLARGRVHVRIRFVDFSQPKETVSGAAYSLPDIKPALNQLTLVAGRFPRPHASEVVVLSQFAKAHHLRIGDRIDIAFPVGRRWMKVVGQVLSPEHVIVSSPDGISFSPQERRFGIVYLPFSTLASLSGMHQQYNEVLVQTINKEPPAVLYTLNQVAKRLHHFGVRYRLLTKDQMSINMLNMELANIKITATFFPVLFLFVGLLIINVLLQRMIRQQRGIIGMLKAMGMSNITIMLHYLSYGLLIGLFGSLVGFVIGWWMQHALISLYISFFAMPNLTAYFHFHVILFGALFSIMAAVLGSLIGAWRAVSLNPAAAMKSNLAENNLPKLSSQLYLWQRSSFYTKMAVRSVVRDPLRSFVAIITVVMSLSLVYLALSMRDSMVTMVDMSISQLSRYDLELNLRQPVSEDFLDSIASTSGVVHTETQLVVPARINLGPYQKEVVLQGLPKFHYLYTPLNDQRSPVRIPAHGVVLSKMLAEILHAKLGDTVNIAPLLGQRLVFRAKIVGLVTSYMGAPIYLNQAWLSEKLGSAMAFNRVLVKVRKGYSIKDFKQILSHLKNVNSVQYIGTFKSELLDMIDKFLGGFIAVILLFSAIIAVGSIYNTAMISVNERQRDIATLSVLGLNSWQIFRIFLLEGLILLVIGLLVGMPAAYYMSKLLSYTYNTEMLRFPVVIYFHRLYESVIILGLFFVMSYLVVLRFIAKTVWQELLNIRE